VSFRAAKLKALDFAHSLGIMHRDFKPPNVFIDAAKRQLTLGDFGGADYYWPGRDYSVGVTTFVYKAPELLVGLTKYDYGVDVWAFGCVLASWVFRTQHSSSHAQRRQNDLQPPFFDPDRHKLWAVSGEDRHDTQLCAIVQVLGKGPLRAYLSRYNLTLPLSTEALLKKLDARLPVGPAWQRLLTKPGSPEAKRGAPMGGEMAVDLVKRILVYDHRERLSAKEALAHPLFGDLRMSTSAPSWRQWRLGGAEKLQMLSH